MIKKNPCEATQHNFEQNEGHLERRDIILLKNNPYEPAQDQTPKGLSDIDPAGSQIFAHNFDFVLFFDQNLTKIQKIVRCPAVVINFKDYFAQVFAQNMYFLIKSSARGKGIVAGYGCITVPL